MEQWKIFVYCWHDEPGVCLGDGQTVKNDEKSVIRTAPAYAPTLDLTYSFSPNTFYELL